MSTTRTDDDPVVHYYDGDYPSPDDRFPENLDERAVAMGVADDVPWYARLARATGGPVLDLGCGTGRLSLPLARAGLDVTAVDASAAMLAALREKASPLPDAARARVRIEQQDMAALDLDAKDHRLACFAFSTLLCVADFARQLDALRAAAAHVADDGVIALDVHNPRVLPPGGDPVPRRILTRRDPHSGRRYTRFATLGPIDDTQRQVLEGWYEEEGAARRSYRITWRLIHRYELELMLRAVGFELASIEGGPNGEPYSARCERIFVTARRLGPTPSPARGEMRREPSGTAATSLFTAAARAAEGQRAEPLFRDPLAHRFAGDAGRRMLADLDGERSTMAIAIRTRWFDERVTRALASGVRVIATLGAGLDTRWHRLGAPEDALWIELDSSEILAYKADRTIDVTPRCRVVSIAGSVGDAGLAERLDAAITGAGGDARAPRLAIVEGVMAYLAEADAAALLEAIAAMPPGSAALLDVPSTQAIDPDGPAGRFVRTLARAGVAWRFGCDDPAALAARHGLSAEVTFVGSREAHFGRLAGPPIDDGATLPFRTWLVHARVAAQGA